MGAVGSDVRLPKPQTASSEGSLLAVCSPPSPTTSMSTDQADGIFVGQTMLFTVGPEQYVNGTNSTWPLKEDPTGQQGRALRSRSAATRPAVLSASRGTALRAGAHGGGGGLQQLHVEAPSRRSSPSTSLAPMRARSAHRRRIGLARRTRCSGSTCVRLLAWRRLRRPRRRRHPQAHRGLIAAGAAAGGTIIMTRLPPARPRRSTRRAARPRRTAWGSRGSRLQATIARALTAAKRAYPSTVDVVFWGGTATSTSASTPTASRRVGSCTGSRRCSFLSDGAATLCCSAPRRTSTRRPT